VGSLLHPRQSIEQAVDGYHSAGNDDPQAEHGNYQHDPVRDRRLCRTSVKRNQTYRCRKFRNADFDGDLRRHSPGSDVLGRHVPFLVRPGSVDVDSGPDDEEADDDPVWVVAPALRERLVETQ
jgi:hypothetical protein